MGPRLRNLVVGRIAFTPRPEARVYEFSGRGSFGRLLAGTSSVVTPAGFEPAFTVLHALLNNDGTLRDV